MLRKAGDGLRPELLAPARVNLLDGDEAAGVDCAWVRDGQVASLIDLDDYPVSVVAAVRGDDGLSPFPRCAPQRVIGKDVDMPVSVTPGDDYAGLIAFRSATDGGIDSDHDPDEIIRCLAHSVGVEVVASE